MPTVVERLEAGIYQSSWDGIVKIEEIFEARDKISDLATNDQFNEYVVVVIGKETRSIPMDLRMLTQTIGDGTIAILVVDSPFSGTLMGRMFNKIMPMKTEFFSDKDALMARARVLLAQETQS